MIAWPSTVERADGPPPVVPSDVPRDTPLTRVSLAYVERRINLYLRFGRPQRELRLDRWRRCASFLPSAIFCRVRWESNDYGTTRWQLLVMQTCAPGERMQRIVGIRPGANLLLRAEGEAAVQAVLQRIDAIEALAVNPADAAPTYWHTLGNRLAARQPLPAYGADRHEAWLRGEDSR